MSADFQYFEYLKKTSLLGEIYRSYYLYPRISKLLIGRVLDVGCGLGGMIRYRPNTIGVDINLHNVQYCQEQRLLAHSMTNDLLPFENNQFDSVLLDNVLEHISRPEPLLKEIQRVLKINGVLVIGVPGALGMLEDDTHVKFYGEIELKVLAKNNNFEVQRFSYMPLCRSNLLSNLLKQYCIYSVWKIAC